MDSLIKKALNRFWSLKTLYYLLFTGFVSFFGAYRIKMLLADWKSMDIDLIYLLPITFILLLCGSYFAHSGNFVENLIIDIGKSENKPSKIKHTNILYAVLIILSFLFGYMFHELLTLTGKGITINIISSSLIRYLIDIGSGFFLLLLCILAISSFISVAGMFEYKRPSVKSIILFLFLVATANIVAVYYIASTKTVYYWDNVGYWIISQQMSDMLFTNVQGYIDSLYKSILTSDYNNLPVVPISIIMKFFGKSRLVYILSILNVYYVPVLWFLRKAILQFLSELDTKVNKELIYYISFLFFPIVLFVTFAGFVDAGGLIIISLVILIYFKESNNPLQKSFFLGLILALLYLFRRWYMFWIISFIACTVIHTVIKCILHRKNLNTREKLEHLSSILILPITFGSLLTLFFQPLVVNKLLLANYSAMYSAYDFGISKDFYQIMKYFGIIVPILSLLSVAASLTVKSARTKVIFLASQIIICFTIFTRVQTHGSQHYLMYVPGIMILIAFLTGWVSMFKKQAIALSLVILIGIMGAFNSTLSFFDTLNIDNTFLKTAFNAGFFATQRIIPVRRGDMQELQNLLSTIDQLSQEGSKKIGVLASSFTFNIDVLKNLEMSLGIPEKDWKRRPYLASSTTVDQRSTTPFWLFGCDYVVLGDPPQYHLNPNDQMVVVLPTNNILNGIGFGRAFKRLDYSFKLDKGNTIYIYERIRNVSQEEAQSLAEEFHKLYPQLPNQYPPTAPKVE